MSTIDYEEAMYDFLSPHTEHDIKIDEYDSDGTIGVSIWCDTCGVVLSSGEKSAIKVAVKKVEDGKSYCGRVKFSGELEQGNDFSIDNCKP